MLLLKRVYSMWLSERESEELTQLDQDALDDAQRFISRAESELEKVVANLLALLLEDITRMRITKLVKAALEGSLKGSPLPRERELFKHLRALLEGERQPTPTFDFSMLEIEAEPIEHHTKSLIVLTSDIPPFYGVDGLVYRGLRKGTVANVPRENAKLIREKRELRL